MGKRKSMLCLMTASIMAIGYRWKYKKNGREIAALKSVNDKLSDNCQLLNHWLELKHENKSLATYFRDLGYKRIAIYGMAELANRLMEELEGSGISVIYGIDRDAGCSISRISDVYSPQMAKLPDADAIVVTPYYALEAIREKLKNKVECPIISIEEVIWSV
ncbi:MAG: hypothetical protein HFI63_11855 [Lachnospiraceae bacterium]|nr:hypothetical protein [Lachnospiraceae bacterium]